MGLVVLGNHFLRAYFSEMVAERCSIIQCIFLSFLYLSEEWVSELMTFIKDLPSAQVSPCNQGSELIDEDNVKEIEKQIEHVKVSERSW